MSAVVFTGQPSSRVSIESGRGRRCEGGGTRWAALIVSVPEARRGRRTWNVWKIFARQPGIPGPTTCAAVLVRTVQVKRRNRDARAWEVRLRHTSAEAREQGRARSRSEGIEQVVVAGECRQQNSRRAQNRISVSHALERIRQVANARKKVRFTALLHHINVDLLRLAYFELKRKAAPGVDGLTWSDYGADLEGKRYKSA